MAKLVVNTGIQPSEYLALTPVEREAIVDEFNRVHRSK